MQPHHKHYQLTLLWLYDMQFQDCPIYLKYHYVYTMLQFVLQICPKYFTESSP